MQTYTIVNHAMQFSEKCKLDELDETCCYILREVGYQGVARFCGNVKVRASRNCDHAKMMMVIQYYMYIP